MDQPKYRGYSYGVRHLVANESLTLLDFVDRQLALEGERPELTALELIELGSIYVNDERCLNVARALEANDSVRIHTKPRRYSKPAELMNRIVSETDDVLIVDKPAGLPVHALVDNIKDNLISFLEEARGGHLFITHRLDVETSGLLLLAKNPAAQTRLNKGFADGTIKRVYAAYTEAAVSLGGHIHFMEPTPTAPKKVDTDSREGWLHCSLTVLSCERQMAATNVITEGRTTWQISDAVGDFFRLTIELATGRPQQIRAQLAALGAPILGDVKYGSPLTVIDSETEKTAVALRAIHVIENSRET